MVVKYNIHLDDNKHPVLVKERAWKISGKGLTSPEKIVELCNYLEFEKKAEEHVYMMCFSTKNDLLGLFEVSHGTINASFLSPREIFQRALLCGANGFILVHNHPSGIPEPSYEDKSITRRIKDVGELMKVRLMDHIILGETGKYCSLAEEGYI